ncbi:hypothetical protein OROHE_009709 [Orobanche hederae]
MDSLDQFVGHDGDSGISGPLGFDIIYAFFEGEVILEVDFR